MHNQPIEARRIGSWMDLTAIDMRRTMEYYNANPPILKILFGGYGGVESRKIDLVVTDEIADAYYPRLNGVFHVPLIRDHARMSRISLAIPDAIWGISVRLHGTITEVYYGEALRAVIAYRRLYFPDMLEPRDCLREAAARGEAITLPFLVAEAGPNQAE